MNGFKIDVLYQPAWSLTHSVMAALEAAIHRKEYFAHAARWAAGSSHGRGRPGQATAVTKKGKINACWYYNYIAFSSTVKAQAFERYLKQGSGHAFANKRLW